MATVQSYSDRPQRLTAEQRERQIERLTMPPRPVERRDPFPVCPTTVLPQADIDQMTNRLYTQSCQQRQANQEELEKRYGQAGAGVHAATLTEEEQQRSVDRLYTQSLENRRRALEESRKQSDADAAAKAGSGKKIPRDTFVQRMYYDKLAAQKEKEQKLYDKYITATDLPVKSMSAAQVAESADRLSGSK